MNKPKFMPAPFEAEIITHSLCDTGDYYAEYAVIVTKDGKKRAIANIFPVDYNEDEAEANLHLFAAAPEMYYVLQHYFDLLEQANNGDAVAECKLFEDIVLIEQVLMKARGEA